MQNILRVVNVNEMWHITGFTIHAIPGNPKPICKRCIHYTVHRLLFIIAVQEITAVEKYRGNLKLSQYLVSIGCQSGKTRAPNHGESGKLSGVKPDFNMPALVFLKWPCLRDLQKDLKDPADPVH